MWTWACMSKIFDIVHYDTFKIKVDPAAEVKVNTACGTLWGTRR